LPVPLLVVRELPLGSFESEQAAAIAITTGMDQPSVRKI
jgi:hypothetical protein